MARRFLTAMLLLSVLRLGAEDEAPKPQYEPAIKPKVVQLPDGRLDLGGVIVDPEKKTATFPVRINEKSDLLIEYILVNENGKIHESLLKTSVQPFHLHTAMLLLGIKRAGDPPKAPVPENINKEWLENAEPIPGPPVTLQLKIGEKTIPVESLVWDESRQASMQPGQWVYHGSYFSGAAFMAEVDGSFGSLIIDPAALFSSTDEKRIDDQNWLINASSTDMPAAGEVILLEIFLTPPSVDESPEPDILTIESHEN